MKYIPLLLLLLPLAAHGVVTDQSISVSYTCTGSVGPYAFTFPISAPAALTVTENGNVLASTSYSVQPVNNNYTNGGSITLNSACASGTLTITRTTPLTQTSAFYENMPVPFTTLGNGLDKLTEIEQEQAANVAANYCSRANPAGCLIPGTGVPPDCIGLSSDLPMGLGAACVGDGVTDDTACFLSHVEYANSHAYNGLPNATNQACVQVNAGPAGSPKKYLIKAPTDMCAVIGNPTAACSFPHGMTVVGDGNDVSVLVPDLSSPGPFLDFGGAIGSQVHDLSIIDVTGDKTTIAVLFSEGNQSINDDDNRFYHATIRLQNGANPQNIGLIFGRTDISGPGDDVNIVTQGTGLISGNGGGAAYANGFTSPFYTLFNGSGYFTGSDADTHQYLGSNANYVSTNSSPIQLTGSDEYDMGGNVYATLDGNTTTVPGVVTVSFTGREYDSLFFSGLRTEDHGTHSGTIPCAIWLTSAVQGGRIDGALTTGQGGCIFGGTSAGTMAGVNVTASTGGVGSGYSLFNIGSVVASSHFTLNALGAQIGTSMGTISQGSYNSEVDTGVGLTTAQILAGMAGSGQAQQDKACGSDGCVQTSFQFDARTVGNLPQGFSLHFGQLYMVGDATTASAQNQACVGTGTIGGPGTTYATAFFNGTVWICNGTPLPTPGTSGYNALGTGQNQALYSWFDFGIASGPWTNYCDVPVVTPNYSGQADPLGGHTAAHVVASATGGGCGAALNSGIKQIFSLTAGQVETGSFWVSTNGGPAVTVNVGVGVAGASGGTTYTVPSDTQWHQVFATYTPLTSGMNNFYIYTSTASAAFNVWQGQLEPTTSPGPCLHTTSAALPPLIGLFVGCTETQSLPGFTLTTSGTSGAASLNGQVLNIPQYTGGGGMVYPGAGVPLSTGSAWGSSYTVGTAANNLVQLNGSAQLPAVDGSLLTSIVQAIGGTSPIVVTPTGTSYNISCPSCGSSTGGTNLSVNGGSSLGSANLNSTTPAAGSGYTNATVQIAGANVSLEIPDFTSAQLMTMLQALTGCNTASYVLTPQSSDCVPAGAGSVTSFSSGNLSPLFTTSVATATSTPAQTFSLSNAAQNSFFAGPATGGTGAPAYRAIVPADVPTLNQATTAQAGSVANSLTINNSGAGAAPPASYNGATAVSISCNTVGAPCKIASGTVAMPTTSVAANSCDAAPTTATATGTLTTDVIAADFNSDPTAITGYNSGVFIMKYPTADTVNFKRCNNTASPISPSAATLNWQVTR